ncbi:MAG: hypothetical protein UHB38_09650 [Anaerovibrio sp.]|nr:hypothetical protein [Anaerovibrio sp.]
MNTILIIKLYLAAAVRCMIGMIGAINWTNRYALITASTFFFNRENSPF